MEKVSSTAAAVFKRIRIFNFYLGFCYLIAKRGRYVLDDTYFEQIPKKNEDQADNSFFSYIKRMKTYTNRCVEREFIFLIYYRTGPNSIFFHEIV